MQGCPLSFSNIKNTNLLEGFTNSNDNNDKNTDWYEKVRSSNLDGIDNTYNQYLADYLNEYNRYLVLKGLQENADPSSADSVNFTDALNTSEKNYINNRSKLEDLSEEIENNNKYSQELIDKQTKDIENKTKTIYQKNNLIGEQTKIIDDRNKIMNSRVKQIQAGIEKNLYKRNVMYFLIAVNIIVLAVLFFVIFKG